MPELRAGYGEKMITPPLGVELSGYGYYLNRRAESVGDHLKARALWLNRGAENVLLISCDLLGFTVAFTDAVRRSLAADLALPAEHVLLACTHTHTGPATMPLESCGSMDPEYMEKLPAMIGAAALAARADCRPASARALFETVTPIGYNRRLRNFERIDPTAKTLILERKDKKIYLINYACHAVTLGPVPVVSADWPGALVAAVEKSGHSGIVFQGFCGDVDPVCFKNRWGKGARETIAVYGEALFQQIVLAEKYAEPVEIPKLHGVEQRIRLPLCVPDRAGIQREKRELLAEHGRDPGAVRAVERWAALAEGKLDSFRADPWLAGVPIHKIMVGELAFLGLPGEVFGEYGLELAKRYSALFTIGYSGGDVGYIPSAAAYQSAGDYACYLAPKLYQLFPFAPGLEDVVFHAGRSLLGEG